MAKPEPIIDRIRMAFQGGEKKLTYHALATRVFPPDQFPNAWGHATKGGPPGCFMALSAALRRHKIEWGYDPPRSHNRVVYRPKLEPHHG